MRELIAAQTNLESLLFQVPNRVVGFDSISSAAQDLLRNMLTVDSSKRLTVDEFFEHPWMTRHMGKRQSSQTRPSS